MWVTSEIFAGGQHFILDCPAKILSLARSRLKYFRSLTFGHTNELKGIVIKLLIKFVMVPSRFVDTAGVSLAFQKTCPYEYAQEVTKFLQQNYLMTSTCLGISN